MAGLAARGWGGRGDEDQPVRSDRALPRTAPEVEIRDFVGLRAAALPPPAEARHGEDGALQIELVNLRNHVLGLGAERKRLEAEREALTDRIEHLEEENESLHEKAAQLSAKLSTEKVLFHCAMAVLLVVAAACVKLMLDMDLVSGWRD